MYLIEGFERNLPAMALRVKHWHCQFGNGFKPKNRQGVLIFVEIKYKWK